MFNALESEPNIEPHVFYLRRGTPGRQWTEVRKIQHQHEFVNEWRLHPTFYLNPGLVKRVLSTEPDVLIITQYASIGMQSLMYRFALTRRPWIFWSEAPGVEHSEAPPLKSALLRRLFRHIALIPIRRWPSQIWGIGKLPTERFQRMYGKQATHKDCSFENVPYYFDQVAFRSIERGDASPEEVRLLFSGKLVYRKAFDVLMASLEQLIEQRNDFSLTVLGDGPQAGLVESASPRLREKIEFAGFKEVSEVPDVYAKCDAMVFPSRYDGWGLAVVEAMASGMPVVGSSGANSVVDAIDEGKTGFVYDPNDQNGLTAALNRLLDAKDRIPQMGKRAREAAANYEAHVCLLYTSPSPRDATLSRMPSSA